MKFYSWASLIGGMPLFIAFLLTFQKNLRATVCSAILWVIGIIVYSGMGIYTYLLDDNMHFAYFSDTKLFWVKCLIVIIAVLSVAASALLFPWITKKLAMQFGKILLLIIMPTLLLLISALTIYPSYPMVWTFPLGASYIGYTVLWFRIRENFDAAEAMPEAAVPCGEKFRMARVIGWTTYGVVVTFLLLLAAPDRISRAMFPFMFPHRATSSGNACLNNLRQIDAAANQFALEHHLTNGAPIHFPDDLTPYIKLNSAGKIPGCPAGGIYRISKVGEMPTCSLGSTVTPAHVLP
jgi:hypothetical protein